MLDAAQAVCGQYVLVGGWVFLVDIIGEQRGVQSLEAALFVPGA